jgi:integrase
MGYLRKKGNKYYAVVFVSGPNGEPKRKEIATGEENEKKAQKILNKIEAQIEENTFTLPDNITVAQYLKEWLNLCEHRLSPTTFEGYENIIKNHINPTLGNKQLQKLSAFDVEKYYILKLKTLSAKTVLQHHRILHRAFGQAVIKGLIQKNPCDYIEAPKPKKYHAKVLKPEEIPVFINAFKNTIFEVPVHLALGLGLRRGEIFGLRWQDIDFDEGVINIHQTLVRTTRKLHFKEPKSETSIRSLSIPVNLLALLKAYKKKQNKIKMQNRDSYNEEYDLVMCNEIGEPINPDSFTKRFQEFIENNNLPKIRFHDLRHTNATLMLKGKIQPKIASKRLGHSTVAITNDLYSHVLDEMDKEASDVLDKIIYGE